MWIMGVGEVKPVVGAEAAGVSLVGSYRWEWRGNGSSES